MVCDNLGGRVGWEVGGTHVSPWLVHVDVWQKPVQYCKAIILQLNINKLIFKERKARLNSSGLKTTLWECTLFKVIFLIIIFVIQKKGSQLYHTQVSTRAHTHTRHTEKPIVPMV